MRTGKTALALYFFALAAAHAQSLPPGAGKTEFQRTCSVCHTLDRATSQRMTRPEWAAVVNDMVAKGAQASSADLDNIVSYLSANFSKASAPAPASQASAPLPAPAALPAVPLTPAQVAQGEKLIETHGCLTCHRLAGKGSYLGPSLEEVGAHRSPEQLKASLLTPKPNLAPENRTVHMVTANGQTLTGKLLNQDGFSVQVIDGQGELKSVDRLTLKSFSIVTANPMPSYRETLSEGDMDAVVRYLSSRKGAETQ